MGLSSNKCCYIVLVTSPFESLPLVWLLSSLSLFSRRAPTGQPSFDLLFVRREDRLVICVLTVIFDKSIVPVKPAVSTSFYTDGRYFLFSTYVESYWVQHMMRH